MGVRRELGPKITSLEGEETGGEPPAQLAELLQLSLAGNGNPDAPVHVAAKLALAMGSTAAASAATIFPFKFNIDASVQAGKRTPAAALPRLVREPLKNEP